MRYFKRTSWPNVATIILYIRLPIAYCVSVREHGLLVRSRAFKTSFFQIIQEFLWLMWVIIVILISSLKQKFHWCPKWSETAKRNTFCCVSIRCKVSTSWTIPHPYIQSWCHSSHWMNIICFIVTFPNYSVSVPGLIFKNYRSQLSFSESIWNPNFYYLGTIFYILLAFTRNFVCEVVVDLQLKDLLHSVINLCVCEWERKHMPTIYL